MSDFAMYKLRSALKSDEQYALDDALEFVNRVRAELGMNQLKRMPMLYSGSYGFTCVIAYACVVGYRKSFKAYSKHENITIHAPDGEKLTFTMPGWAYWNLARPYQMLRYTCLESRWSGSHSYDKRYNVLQGGCSRYTDSAEEVADWIAEGDVQFVNDGYASYADRANCTEIIRLSGESMPLENFDMQLCAA